MSDFSLMDAIECGMVYMIEADFAAKVANEFNKMIQSVANQEAPEK